MASYILGLDLGTTSVKACLVDSRTKTVVSCFSKDTLAGEGSEQDVSKIISTVQHCVGRISRDHMRHVTRVSVCGQMHGVVLWKDEEPWRVVEHSGSRRFDINSASFSPLYTWQDSRCSVGYLAQLPMADSHLPVASGYGCVTIFWLKENDPAKVDDFTRCGTVQDLLVTMLCDLNTPVMSIQNAASWGYFNTVKKTWNLDILKSAGFPVELLPNVVDSGDSVGKLAISWYGIPAGVEVLAALGDMQCSVLSTLHSATVPSAVVNMSTSAQLSFVMPEEFVINSEFETLQYFPFFNGRYLAVAASLNGGNVLASFVRMLQNWVHELGSNIPQSHIWDRLMNPVSPLSDKDNLVITPVLFGERHIPDSASASVAGITHQNLGLDHIMQALCKGLIHNLHRMFPSDRLSAFGAQQLIGTGSALSRNKILQECLAKEYEPIPFKMFDAGDAALGAAIAALRMF